MVKKILLAIIFFILVKSVSAVENNKFGIHLAQPHFQDLKKAAELVNSSGGDWGYVTLVIQENDRDRKKWQEIFDQLRELHLIPIIRLATKPEGENWRRPGKDEAKDWVEFLDSLNWVVKNRYVILFNEPNHSSEWGGEVDPQNYAEVAFSFAKALKDKNKDFFVMLAGMDASAPQQPPKFFDEEVFLKELFRTAGELVKSENSQKNSNQDQSSGNLNISSNIPDIRFHSISSNLKPIHVKNIPRIISNVNTINAFKPAVKEKFGVINATPSQPADKLIDNPESVLKRAFFDFLEKESFIKIIKAEEKISVKKNLFNYIDGWASHSYPNPGFSGAPWDYGRGTVRTYQWELELLRGFGVNKELPVFITETGWKRDIRYSILDIGNDRIAQNFRLAFEQVWLPDDRIWAVTPFVLNYQSEPFLGFSWKKYQSEEFYPQYYLVKSLPKIKGKPEQVEKGEISFDLPKELLEQSNYQFKIRLKNQGQAIWDKKDGYSLFVISYLQNKKFFEYFFSDLKNIKPFEEKEVFFTLKTKDCFYCEKEEKIKVDFLLKKEDEKIIKSKSWQFRINSLPELKIKADFWPIGKAKGNNFEIQIFDVDDRLVFKKKNVVLDKGEGVVDNIKNIAIDELYRVVILKPGYLPRQSYFVFKLKNNFLRFKKLLPFDFNHDGKFDFSDVFSLFQ